MDMNNNPTPDKSNSFCTCTSAYCNGSCRYKKFSLFDETDLTILTDHTTPLHTPDKPKTVEEVLQTYHPVSRDHQLKTDLWPESTVIDAMEEWGDIRTRQKVEEALKMAADKAVAYLDVNDEPRVAKGSILSVLKDLYPEG